MADPLGLFALFLCLIQVVRSSGQFEAAIPPLREDCFALGLSSNLLCSSCDSLPKYGLESLLADCKTCCHQDKDAEGQKYKRGADPVLKFLNEKNLLQETLSIEKWNTDTVEEFLQERLMP